MSKTEINHNIQTNVFVGISISTAIFALVALMFQQYTTAFTAVIFAALLWLINRNPFGIQADGFKKTLTHILVIALGTTTIASTYIEGGYAIYWAYAFPVITFFLYPINIAITFAMIHCALFTLLVMGVYQGPEKIQLLINYIFCLVLTGAFVYLREEREKQLKPLRRTDNLTLASTREHLTDDLNREVQRSEREGTSVSMLALSIDQDFLASLTSRELELTLQKLGKILHESLRPFDSYYRYEKGQFLITLPLTPTNEAFKQAEELRLQSKALLQRDGVSLTVSIGVSGLNVGDDSDTLINKAISALRKAQAGGKNRTASFTDSDPIDTTKEGSQP